MFSVVSKPCTTLLHWYVVESLNIAMLLVSTDLVTSPSLSVIYSTENLLMFTTVEELLLMMVPFLLHIIKEDGQLGWHVMLKLLPNIMSVTVAFLFTTTVILSGTPTNEN